MRHTWAPVAGLMLAAPFTAEVVGGAMPLLDFVRPEIFFPFVVFLYGLPVLIIRELSIRYGFGPLQMWILGMTYGPFNEGLLSETLYVGLDHAVPAYSAYGVIGGLRLPWLLYILPWHATVSVLIPIMIIDPLFPKTAGRAWLPVRVTHTLTVAVPVLAVVRFIAWGEDRPTAGLALFSVHLSVVLVSGAALVCLASRRIGPQLIDDSDRLQLSWRFAVAGLGAYAATTLAPMTLAHLPAPAVAHVVYSAAVLVAVGWWAGRTTVVTRAQVLSLVIGALALQAATGVVAGALGGNRGWFAVCVIILGLIGIWVGRNVYLIRRKELP